MNVLREQTYLVSFRSLAFQGADAQVGKVQKGQRYLPRTLSSTSVNLAQACLIPTIILQAAEIVSLKKDQVAAVQLNGIGDGLLTAIITNNMLYFPSWETQQ